MYNNKTYIIAEAGVNHNGSMEMAEKLISNAAKIGADAVKFQTFQPHKIVHPKAPQAQYQKETSGSETQFQLLEKLELSREQFIHLKKIADDCGIQFLSTPFDMQSLDFLLELNLPYIKVSSGDLTYGPLLLKIAQNKKKIFLSTGMSTLNEIKDSLNIIAYGYMNPDLMPSSFAEIKKFSEKTNMQEVLSEYVTIFHCTSEYPAPFNEINLNVLETFKNEFRLQLGYSDHSLGVTVPCLAVAKGAKFIEKHFTLDNQLEGPDHKASLDVNQFSEMIKKIRETEEILGNFDKNPTISELKNKPIVRRGVYIAHSIEKDYVLSEKDLVCLRPESKYSPMHMWDILGKKALRAFEILEEYDD